MSKKNVISRFLEYQSSHFDITIEDTIKLFKQNMNIEFESIPDYSISKVIKQIKEQKYGMILSELGSTAVEEAIVSDDIEKNPFDTLYLPMFTGLVRSALAHPL